MAIYETGTDWTEFYAKRGRDRAGFLSNASRTISFSFETGISKIGTPNAGGTGSNLIVNSVVGAIYQATTGGTAAGTAGLIIGTTAENHPGYVAAAQTAHWYAAWRLRTINTVDAQGKIWAGFRAQASGANSLIVGANGAASTTKYSALFDTGASATLLSTVSIETTAFHVFEVWMDGTATYFSVDDETPVRSTDASLSQVSGPQFQVSNGTTNSGRSAYYDQALFVVPVGA